MLLCWHVLYQARTEIHDDPLHELEVASGSEGAQGEACESRASTRVTAACGSRTHPPPQCGRAKCEDEEEGEEDEGEEEGEEHVLPPRRLRMR